MKTYTKIPTQRKLIDSVKHIPIEYFKWGNYPDHFKIDMPHKHEFAELLFFTKGGGVHEIDYCDFKIEKSSIHFVPPSTVHFLKRDIHSTGFTIAFRKEFLESNDIHKIINPLQDDPFVLTFSDVNFSKILNLTNVILEQIKLDKGYYKQKCFLLSFELLLSAIANKLTNETKKQAFGKATLIQKFITKVKKYIQTQKTVSWYAGELHVSPKYLSNHVKTQTAGSAKRLIIQYLLISVKKALLNTNKSIKQIAYEHSHSEANLCKLFKKNVGYSMSVYRSYEKMKK